MYRERVYTHDLEPQGNFSKITSHVDLEQAYEDFSKTYNIPQNTFALTKGLDEAIALCYRVINYEIPKFAEPYIYTTNPYTGFGAINIFNWDFGIQELEYKFKKDHWVPNKTFQSYRERLLNEKCAIFYNSSFYNSKHSVPIPMIHEDYTKYFTDETYDSSILDYAYTAANYFAEREKLPLERRNREAWELYPNVYIIEDDSYTSNTLRAWGKIVENGNIEKYKFRFVVGSYDFAVGFGVQLGYVLFYPYYAYLFESYRPSYISPLAAMHCKVEIPPFDIRLENTKYSIEFQEPKFEADILQEGKYVDIHTNFISMKEEDYKGPLNRIDWKFEDFNSGTKFVRLGMVKE